MPVFSAAEHLSTALALRVVAIIEALWEIGATIAVGESAVRDLKVRVTKGGSEGMTAPNGFVFVEERISFS